MASEVTISKAVTKLVLDATDLEEGAVASRQELRYVNRALRQLETPMERYEKDLEKANSLLKFGADGQELYRRAVAKAEAKLKEATGETARARAAEKQLTDDRRRAERIIESQTTATEKLERNQRVLNRLYEQGLIDLRQYRKELDRLNDEYDKANDQVDGLANDGSTDQIASRFGLDGLFGQGSTALTANLFLLDQAIKLTEQFYEALRRAGEFAIERFNTDRLKIDETIKAARALDIDLKSLTGLQFAFGQTAGFTDDQTIKALRELTKRTSEAAMGMGETRLAFREVGLSAQELNRLAPEDRILKIAEALAKLDNQADRFRLAGRFFGEEQAEIVLGLAGGTDNLLEALEKAERLGIAFSDEDGRRVEKMNDAFDRLSRLGESLSRRLTIAISDDVLSAVERVESVVDRMANTGILNGVGDFVAANIYALELAVGVIESHINEFSLVAKTVVDGFREFVRLNGLGFLGTGIQFNGRGSAIGDLFRDPDDAIGNFDGNGQGFAGADPLESINAASREAFNIEFRTELNNQMQIERDQLATLQESNAHHAEMAATMASLNDKIGVTDLD